MNQLLQPMQQLAQLTGDVLDHAEEIVHAFGWQPAETRTGSVKAVGTGPHSGQTLYGAKAQKALAAKGGGKPKTTPAPAKKTPAQSAKRKPAMPYNPPPIPAPARGSTAPQTAAFRRQVRSAQPAAKRTLAKPAGLSPALAKHEAAIQAIIARDKKEPDKVTDAEVDAVLKPLATLPKEDLAALAKKITGLGGRSAQDSLQRLRADMTAVRRLLESQRV